MTVFTQNGDKTLLTLQLSDGDDKLDCTVKITGPNEFTQDLKLKNRGHGLYNIETSLDIGQYSAVFRIFYKGKPCERYPIVTDDIVILDDATEKLKNDLKGMETSLKKSYDDIEVQFREKFKGSSSQILKLAKAVESLQQNTLTMKKETLEKSEQLAKDFEEFRDSTEPVRLMEDFLKGKMSSMICDAVKGVDELSKFQMRSDMLKGEVDRLNSTLDGLREEKKNFEQQTQEMRANFTDNVAKTKEAEAKLTSVQKFYEDNMATVRKIPSELAVELEKKGDVVGMYFDGINVIDNFPKIYEQMKEMPDCSMRGYLSKSPYTYLGLIKKYKSASTDLVITDQGELSDDQVPFEIAEAIEITNPTELRAAIADQGLYEIKNGAKNSLYSNKYFTNDTFDTGGAYANLLKKIELSEPINPSKIDKTELFNSFVTDDLAMTVEENNPQFLFIKDGNKAFIKQNFNDVTDKYQAYAQYFTHLSFDCAIFKGSITDKGVLLNDILYFNGVSVCNETYENRRKLLESIGEENGLFEDNSPLQVQKFSIVTNKEQLVNTVNTFAKEGKRDLLFKPLQVPFSLSDKSSNPVLNFSLNKGEWI